MCYHNLVWCDRLSKSHIINAVQNQFCKFVCVNTVEKFVLSLLLVSVFVYIFDCLSDVD